MGTYLAEELLSLELPMLEERNLHELLLSQVLYPERRRRHALTSDRIRAERQKRLDVAMIACGIRAGIRR